MTHDDRGSQCDARALHVPSALGSREGRARFSRGKTEVGTKHTTWGQVSSQEKPRYSRDEKVVDGRVYFRARDAQPAVELGRNRKARSSFSLQDSRDLANADFDIITRAATLANQNVFVLPLNLGRLLSSGRTD
jgi:hypothetical protein